jgi:hypothetical protein
VTPPGKRAVTISVDNISSLAGMVKAGDRVDVIALISQNIPGPDGKSSPQLITLPVFQMCWSCCRPADKRACAENGYKVPPAQEKQDANPLITLALTRKKQA